MSSSRKLDDVLPFILCGEENTIETAMQHLLGMNDPQEVLDTMSRRYEQVAENKLSSYNEMLLLEKIIVLSRPAMWPDRTKSANFIKACQRRLVKLYET